MVAILTVVLGVGLGLGLGLGLRLRRMRPAAEHLRDRINTQIVEQIQDAILVTDPAGLIQYVNPAFERSTGYGRSEVVGRSPRLLKSGKHQDGFYRDLWSTIAAGRVYHGQLVNRRKDGSLFHEAKTITPLVDEKGRIRYYVSTGKDVSDLQTAREQRLEATRRMSGGLTHHFSNLLQTMCGFTEMALNEPEGVDREVRSLLEHALQNGRRAQQLMKELAACASPPLARRSLDLGDVMRTVVARFDAETDGRAPIALQIEAAPPVVADPDLVDDILSGVLENAVEASPGDGRIDVAVAACTGQEFVCSSCHDNVIGDYVTASIRDSGPGVADEIIDAIFDPFFSTKEAAIGVADEPGLGLSRVHGLMHGHGGHIEVRSAGAQGTEVRLHFPPQTVSV